MSQYSTQNTVTLLTEAAIDQQVIAQAEDDTAWDEPIQVQPSRASTIALPAELAARAAFLARLHRQSNMEEWLNRIIQERIELEEAAFAGAKRALMHV